MDKKEKARFLLHDEVNQAISDDVLDFNFDLIEAEILSYCHRLDFPTGLMLIVIKMVAEYTQAQYYQAKMINKQDEIGSVAQGAISSISRGDTTISYSDNTKVTEYGNPVNAYLSITGFVSDYKSQIKQYRKLATLW